MRQDNMGNENAQLDRVDWRKERGYLQSRIDFLCPKSSGSDVAVRGAPKLWLSLAYVECDRWRLVLMQRQYRPELQEHLCWWMLGTR